MRLFTLVASFVFMQNLLNTSVVLGKSIDECIFKGKPPKGIECGTLVVKEDHFSEWKKFYQLPYLMITPDHVDHDFSPVIFLNGGPGYSTGIDSIASTIWWKRLAKAIAPNRVFIVPELRGSRSSNPSLDCPELHFVSDALNVDRAVGKKGDLLRASVVDPAVACLSRLEKEGRNLSSINRLQIAYDIKALAVLIGLRKVALLGTSYGSTYAMTIASEFPEMVEMMILDSVFPPQATGDIRNTYHLEHTLTAVFAECDAQRDCRESFPNLEEQFHFFLKELDELPLEVPFINRQVHERQIARLDAITFFNFLRAVLGWPGFLEGLPKILVERDMELLTFWIQLYADYGGFENFSYGAFMSGNCFDLPLDFEQSSPEDNMALLEKLEIQSWGLEFCDDWNSERASEEYRKPLLTDIPTLILVSEFDPATPAYQAQMVRDGLSNSHFYKFPGGVHSLIIDDKCAHEIAKNFLSEPTDPIVLDCFRNYPAFKFQTGD